MLFVGRVEASSRWKGLSTLVEALALAAPLVPGIGLDVVGDGDDVPRLQRLAQARGVADLVTWHGTLTHAELVGRYRSAGVTVLPSLTEAVAWAKATTRPSAWLARILWWLAGRILPCRVSSFRLHISLTGRWAAFEIRAASIAAS